MMAVVFPARVKISYDGEIQAQHGFEDVFGVNISALEDFPTEQGEHELQQVVDNAQASLVPLKHKMRLRPRMGPMVFVCNICAANDVGSRTVILGFEILESFETTAVARAPPATPRERAQRFQASILSDEEGDALDAVTVSES